MCQGIIFHLKFDKQFQSMEKYFELLYGTHKMLTSNHIKDAKPISMQYYSLC